MSGVDIEGLARTGSLTDRRVVAYLDSLELPMVMGILGAGSTVTTYAEPARPKWRVGDGRPGLADDDPAVICAIGRCALARWRHHAVYGDLAMTTLHAAACGWCAFPAEELQRALDWALWASRYITEEWVVWSHTGGTYRRRTGRDGTYENPRWQSFVAAGPKAQRDAVEAVVVASRDMLDDVPPAPVTGPAADRHAPWCDLRDDHPGDCPNPPEEPTDG